MPTPPRLASGGAALGVFSEWPYQQAEIALAPGDRLLRFRMASRRLKIDGRLKGDHGCS